MKILVALDETQKDDPALEKIGHVARAAGAEVILVNVYSPLLDLGDEPPGPREEQERHVEAQRHSYLQEKARLLGDVQARTIVGQRHSGEEVHDVIARIAREEAVEVLAVSSKHITSLAGVMLGSTAQALLRISPCPVLVVRTH